ncbi:MAG: hypothetical protein ACRD0W_00120, partial [Acidimicrobiales bacterium]
MTQPNPFAPQQQQAPPAGNPFGQPPAQQQPPPPQQPPAGNPFAGQQQQQQTPASDEFGQPGSGGGDRVSGDVWRSYVGSLVLFEVRRWLTDVNTENGVADAAMANVHVIDING